MDQQTETTQFESSGSDDCTVDGLDACDDTGNGSSMDRGCKKSSMSMPAKQKHRAFSI